MYGRNSLYRLDFHDYKVFHEYVQPESEIEPNAVADHWKGQLHGGGKSSLMQCVHQRSQIHAFQKPRSQCAVDFHRGIHDGPADLVEMHFCVLSVLCGCIAEDTEDTEMHFNEIRDRKSTRL